MSTAASSPNAVMEEALRRIATISTNVPISTTLTELQIVVERLTFSGLHEREVQNDPATIAEIELFFRDAVSGGMVQFLRWMAGHQALGVLGGEPGRIFLDRCISEYRKVEEVQVVTAIDLSDEERSAIASRLRAVHPEPARILFTTSSSIIAGFVLHIGSTVVDKSLRHHVSTNVPRSSRLEALIKENG